MVLAEYNLGELKRKELVTENFNIAKSDYILKASHPGLAVLVKRVQSGEVPT